VPIQPRHIAVLFRRFVSFGEDVTRKYTDAIEGRGIPHLLVGGKAFHDREEVEAVRAALAAIEWPDDELSVFATLKGSFFAIDDEHLLEYRDRYKGFHPFRIPAELGGNLGHDLALTAEPIAPLMPIADALRVLQELHRRRNYRPVADTITRLLESTRAHVGLILRTAGEQALANVLHVAELARQRSDWRHLVSRLHRSAAGCVHPGGRGADPRRGQRRRPADDGAQGERPRVSGRDPRGHDVPAGSQRRVAISRPRSRALCDAHRRLGTA
jgi:ATP-dependent exoDNAse (exonuclease V) beta subunit